MEHEQHDTTKSLKLIITIVGIFILTVVSFAAGVFVGVEKTKFSYGWNQNYFHNFVDRKGPMFDKGYLNTRGIFGEIIKIDNATLLINGQDKIERTIITNKETAIRKGSQDLKIADLKVNDKIVVIGAPNKMGQIEAKLIRVPSENDPMMPPLPLPEELPQP